MIAAWAAVAAIVVLGIALGAPASADAPVPFALSGTVTNLGGDSGVTVSAGFWNGSSFSYEPAVSVGTDGTYSVETTDGPGQYDLKFAAGYSSPFFTTYFGGNGTAPSSGAVGTFGVIDGSLGTDLSGQDVVLISAGYITGTVSSGGTPLAGEEVKGVDTSSNASYAAQSPTDASGSYSMKVPAGDSMELFENSDSGYSPQYYDQRSSAANADSVTVAAGATKSGVNFTLVPIATTAPTAPGKPAKNGPLAITGSTASPSANPSPTPGITGSAETRPSTFSNGYAVQNPPSTAGKTATPWFVWVIVAVAILILVGGLGFVIVRGRRL